jgi:hypothetical protein
MKTEQVIRDQIEKLAAADAHKEPAADIEVNAPLALLQTEIDAKIAALEWVLR